MVVVRVLEGESSSPEGAIRARLARMQSIIDRSEKIVKSALDREKTDPGGARILKRRAREEARMAMRLIGILLIEYGLDMTDPIARTRRIVLVTRGFEGVDGFGRR